MERVTNVLVLEEDGLVFEHVKRQILAWHPNALLVRATGMKQLRYRLKWAAFDFVLVNFSLSDYGALQVLLLVRERFVALPFIFVVDKTGKYSEADIAIIKQADGCVYLCDIFGQIGIIDNLMNFSEKSEKQVSTATCQKALIAKAIALVRRGFGLKNKQEVLSLLKRIELSTRGRMPLRAGGHDSVIGHRSSQEEMFGDDPHVSGGAGAGAG